ncbi:CASP family protein, Golgi vesicle transport factor Coy1 [Schizosaccharomyces pombe]|uniref:Protein CASP n=1 Tax=Schizosaccharomyces pombe (strain 972 / ATCC 24843) TaxID=284812 RepID=CASP_SCHPO|nr:putative CASP domain-containing family protein [Schizosaccharomyces pombe]O59795.1 RecName: Full=Protein CASP [Schizosaccharomyces pombe 972h-]CAA18286.1 CASP family protein involved in Golgi vesicle transport (predicted) [Schizosaccharomyces pombe]|eukprot:NP_587840.1 putative CASP domain-containing family protein [Schizosaccharomyces pombe]
MAVASEALLQKLTESWKNSRFEELQREADEAAAEIEKMQKTSLDERKELSSKTKEFRKQPDEVKLGEMKGLLKLYQSGIDSLTKRAKSAEATFFRVYETLGEVPDPYPLLIEAANNLKTQKQIEDLKKEKEEMEGSLQGKEKLEREVENLRKELDKYKDLVETEAEKRAAITKEECEKSWLEQQKLYKDMEQENASTIQKLTSKIRELQASQLDHDLQASQNESAGLDVNAKSAEVNAILSELDDANKIIVELQAEIAVLKQNTKEQKSGSSQDDLSNQQKQQLDFMDSLNKKLSTELESIKEASRKEMETHCATIQTLENEVKEARKVKEESLTLANKFSDYDEIKRELSVLKQIEFSGEHATHENTSLESQLLKREKQLSEELAKLRSTNAQLTDRITQESKKASFLEQKASEQEEVIRKLEKDLADVDVEGSVYLSNTTYRREGTSGQLSPTSSIMGGNPSLFNGSVLSRNSVNETGSAIVDVIKQQRDRFRRANVTLVNQVSAANDKIALLESKLEEVEKSNTLLYEQMRFRDHYQKHVEPSSSHLQTAAAYENSISPFASFRKKEAERAYSRMGSFERIVYALLRTLLFSRATRGLFFMYLILLHLFIMIVLLKLGIAGNTAYTPMNY